MERAKGPWRSEILKYGMNIHVCVSKYPSGINMGLHIFPILTPEKKPYDI
jgi:hypothetical protein